MCLCVYTYVHVYYVDKCMHVDTGVGEAHTVSTTTQALRVPTPKRTEGQFGLKIAGVSLWGQQQHHI